MLCLLIYNSESFSEMTAGVVHLSETGCLVGRTRSFIIIRRGNFRQKHNYNMAKMMVFIAEQNKNCMFRTISAIIRFSQLLC